MQPFTRRGFFPDPARPTPLEPIFPLHRQRPYARRSPNDARRSSPELEQPFDLQLPLPSSWPFARELVWEEPDDDDFEFARGVPRRTRGSIVRRIVGFVLVSATLFGCGTVLSRPQATREALDWATLGHGDSAMAAMQQVGATVRSWFDGR